MRLLLLAALLLTAQPALAYVDPNAGGMLFQILTPLLVAIAAGWSWIRRAFKATFSRAVRWLTDKA